jgi:hypothetical protein
MSTRAYFLSVVLIPLLCVAGYCSALMFFAYTGIGIPVAAETWVRSELLLKEYFAKNIAEGTPRLLIFSGSSGLFGIDSKLLEHSTGLRTVNLSTHGGLPLGFHLAYASGVIRTGDVVLLLLEYEYYTRPTREDVNPEWWWANMQVAVFPEIFEQHSPVERLSVFLHMKPLDVLGGALTMLVRFINQGSVKPGKAHDLPYVLEKWQTSAHSALKYGVEATDSHGDIEHNCEAKNYKWNYQIASASFNVNVDSIRTLKKYLADWKNRGVAAYISFSPVSVDAAGSPYFAQTAKRLKRYLEDEGIATIGSPSEFVYPRGDFFDTQYHLNCTGRKKNTERLINLLLKRLPLNELDGDADQPYGLSLPASPRNLSKAQPDGDCRKHRSIPCALNE